MGFLISSTALVIGVLMWIHSGLSAITVVGAVLFIPYVLYSGYAFILALDISINYYGEIKIPQSEEDPVPAVDSRRPRRIPAGSRRQQRRAPRVDSPPRRLYDDFA
jgi:hypothetical protein